MRGGLRIRIDALISRGLYADTVTYYKFLPSQASIPRLDTNRNFEALMCYRSNQFVFSDHLSSATARQGGRS